MTETAERDGSPAKDEDHASSEPLPEDCEKLRLRFELELFGSQDAGASLDPLLRRGEKGSRQVHSSPRFSDQA